jgi:hypothetical protein
LNRLKPTALSSIHPGPAQASKFSDSDLWKAFEGFLNVLGGRIISRDELNNLLALRCFIELAAASILSISAVEDDIWDVAVGISLADLAIAETGTLVCSAGEGKRRMSSPAPPVNVIVISQKAIVATMVEAIPLISTATSILVTGPSRTADIEGILVKGVHGPGELLVYVYE